MSKSRNIFEEVGSDAPASRPKAQTGIIDRAAKGARGPIRLWLALIFVLVWVMIAVGGLTRLTDSGLSITEWQPVVGAVPPLSQDAWTAEFEKYQEIPEYQLQNKGMTLAEFKSIYWWEWGHRQLGRVIGLVWALGVFGFLIARRIPSGWTGRLLLLGALGGAQGAIGWWMVSSGLGAGALDVASYRLAVHLGLAFVILGLTLWFILKLGRDDRDLLQSRRLGDRKLWGMSTGLLHLAMLQILLGALVAGIDAGRSYTDWPLMAGGLLPPDPLELRPIWRNLFEDPGLVQFLHRIVGYLLLAFGIGVWMRGRKGAHSRSRRAVHLTMALLAGQVVLGIVTVLQAAPWPLAIAHQFTAVALWSAILWTRFLARYPQIDTIRGGRA